MKRFSAAGWRVFTVSRQPFSEHCPWEGGAESHVQMDLNDISTLPATIADLKKRLPDGKLDALVNNAAISPKGPGGSRMGVLDTDLAALMHVYNVNLFSVALLAKGLFDELKAAQGSIVNVTSIAGSRVHPFAGMAYATSSGLPRRCIGMSRRTISSVPGDRMEVSISPGAMALTRTSCGPNSQAISRVSAAKAALEVA